VKGVSLFHLVVASQSGTESDRVFEANFEKRRREVGLSNKTGYLFPLREEDLHNSLDDTFELSAGSEMKLREIDDMNRILKSRLGD